MNKVSVDGVTVNGKFLTWDDLRIVMRTLAQNTTSAGAVQTSHNPVVLQEFSSGCREHWQVAGTMFAFLDINASESK